MSEINYQEAYEREHEKCADLADKIVVLESEKEEDEISMCELFDQYTRRGISEKEAEEQMKLYW